MKGRHRVFLKSLGIIISLSIIFFFGINFALSYYDTYKQKAFEDAYAYLLNPPYPEDKLVDNKSYIEHENNKLIAIHYPSFNNWEVDEMISQKVMAEINFFEEYLLEPDFAAAEKKGLSILEGNYAIVSFDQDIATFVFNFSHMPGGNSQKKVFFTLTYSFAQNQILELGDFFSENKSFLPTLSALIRTKLRENGEFAPFYEEAKVYAGTEPEIANYACFSLDKQGLSFYFMPGKISLDPNMWEVKLEFKDLIPLCLINQDGDFYDPGPEKNLDPDKPMIALTFDDGPHREFTLNLLDALNNRNASVTFFCLGNRAIQYPELLKRMEEEGHEVGSHGYDHIQAFTKLNKASVLEQLNNTKAAVKSGIGKEPTLIRPPYGKMDNQTSKLMDKPIIMWNVDSLDWQSRDAQKIFKMLKEVKDGDIILMHDIYESSVDGAVLAIDYLQSQGFQFVTVSQLFKYKGIALTPGQTYYSAK